MDSKFIRVTTIKKNGPQIVKQACALNVRDIVFLEHCPEEAPPYVDGVNCLVMLLNQVQVGLAETFEDVTARVDAALGVA